MPTKLKYGIFLGVLVNDSMHQRLVSAAEAQGLTWSDVVRAALDRVLPPGAEAVQSPADTSPAER